jgi:hypothetical protein
VGPPSHRLAIVTAIVAALAAAPRSASAQAFTAPAGVGSVTFGWQFVDNTGHRLSDGVFRAGGQSITTAVLVEADYGVTDRVSATIGIPYVFAKYTGVGPPISGLPLDTCRCWNSAFQDFALGVRYRFGDDRWAVTPILRYGRPSHDYPYAGEAVVGRNLKEVQVGVATGLKLVGFLPKASLQASYTYAFVEKPVESVKIDRSNTFMEFGYALTRGIYVRGDANWQRTNGGLRFGSPSGDPFFPPGELNTPELYSQRDRLLRTNYWHVGGGVSYAAGPVDLFFAYTKYVSGTDTHNGQAYTVGTSWYFDLR